MRLNEVSARYQYVYPLHERARAANTRTDVNGFRGGYCRQHDEMYAGAAKSQMPQRSRARQDAFFIRFASLPFDEAAANEFGRIRAHLEMAGMPIGPYDPQIAAIAAAHGLIVVTHNVKEFGRIPGLQTEDWEV